jgi:low temperature requirement protein LtrA
LLLLLGGTVVGDDQRLALWALAVLLDYGTVFLSGSSGWRVRAPSHFAERHGLIVIIAIGESIVSVGVAVADAPISWPILAGSTLGIIIAVALWWAYFDVVALVAERTLARLTGDARTRLARDSYTYLHLPIVTGIVMLALGTKVVLLQAASAEHSHGAPLPDLALWVMYGGAALFLVSMSALRWRNLGRPNVQRLVVAALLLVAAAGATAGDLPALVHLALVTSALVMLLAYEVIRFRDVRATVRAGHE